MKAERRKPTKRGTLLLQKMGVHGAHCCKHQCKYGDADCPVVMGQVEGVRFWDCWECMEPQTTGGAWSLLALLAKRGVSK